MAWLHIENMTYDAKDTAREGEGTRNRPLGGIIRIAN
jgi:hypothetical protein